ncbi:Coatomer subunit epsilon-1 [Morella rubra]|uniref:Coatomer subunit epsilon-1 n=1 Tax=Morella rubra TaxID=262757 RepID=A0A6A1WJ76_9ROSI|nr:Coatomer subunit epsilon-1 [Morella rubra]
MAAAPDQLFNLRNNFYLGAYQAAINSSDVPNLSPEDAVERDCLVYRSYIALGSYPLVINEIDSSAATPLQAVKLLALYHSNPDDKEATISSLKEWLADPAIGNNPILRLIAGIIFMHEQDYNEALKHTNAGGTMELHALNVQIFLKMYRSDYAERQLRVMQQTDEDHTLTQLASAWLNLAVGGSKIQEAYLIFQDFSEKYQMTSLILNGKAVCCMHMGSFDEAETLLLEALNKASFGGITLLVFVGFLMRCKRSRNSSQSGCMLSSPWKTIFPFSQIEHVCAPISMHAVAKATTSVAGQLEKVIQLILGVYDAGHVSEVAGIQPLDDSDCSSSTPKIRFISSTELELPMDARFQVLWKRSAFFSQLKLSHPDHMLVKRAASAEESFDRALQSVA